MDDKFFLSMVDKFNSANITELEFNDGNTRMFLRKETQGARAAQAPGDTESQEASGPEDPSVRLGISASATQSAGGEKIKSPIVATFYSSSGPDAPPFVKNGAKVKAGQTLCILEAMKMMNHLEAEFDGEILEIHASTGELIEYGQDRFTIRKN